MLKYINQMMNQPLIVLLNHIMVYHQCFMATAEDSSDSDIDSGSDYDSDDDDEELMLELRKVSKKSRETILGLMKKVMKQDQ